MLHHTRRMLGSGIATAAALALAAAAAFAQDDAGATDAMRTAGPMAAGITVGDAWTRESMMADLAAAAYMVIHNGSDTEDALVGASSPAAAVVEIHRSSLGEDGTMSMVPVATVALPPHADTVLAPGGDHLMLFDLAEPLVAGGEIELSLTFEDAAPQVIRVTVTGPMGPGDDMDGSGMGASMDRGKDGSGMEAHEGMHDADQDEEEG